MRPKIKFKSIFIATLILSVICSIYLNIQILGTSGIENEFANSYGQSTFSDKFIFPEVEVVKVVLTKLIDIVTISKL